MARSAKDVVGKYPKGKDIVVYFDPRKPQESVLEKGVLRETIQKLSFGGVFLLAGLLAAIRGIFSR